MLQLTNDLLNSSTAEFKVPFSTDGNTVISAATSIDVHVEAINILIPKLRQTTADIEETIGGHVLAIKAAAPNDWEEIVRARCGISRSRAFELMRIADGTKTVEQTRRETNARQVRFRQNQAVRYITDKKELAATDTQIVELKAVHQRELNDARAQLDELEGVRKRQVARFENEIARLGDARDLSSERDRLHKALGEVVELLVEMRGLMTHSVQNRATITMKIARAKMIAEFALKPAKATTCKSANSLAKTAA
jgi:hypothetical protein